MGFPGTPSDKLPGGRVRRNWSGESPLQSDLMGLDSTITALLIPAEEGMMYSSRFSPFPASRNESQLVSSFGSCRKLPVLCLDVTIAA